MFVRGLFLDVGRTGTAGAALPASARLARQGTAVFD